MVASSSTHLRVSWNQDNKSQKKNKNDPWNFFSTVLLELRRKTEDLGFK